jgi:ATP-dependent Clp protease ATP-binding subunit ClpA
MGPTNVPLDPNKTGREALELEMNLCQRIVGQQEAIREIVSVDQILPAPIGNLLFLGPAGSGKARTVEATAESLVQQCPRGYQDWLCWVPAQS